MIRNLIFCFKFYPKGMLRAMLWEMFHAFLLAAPSGILLAIIWELFRESPREAFIWQVIAAMGAMFFLQLYVAQKAMVQSQIGVIRIATALRVAVGNKLQRLSLGYYKKRDPGELASVALQDVNNFEQIFGHSLS
ncbi:MAG: ABC transporter ATP-binding protein, partial [Bacteroidota bacterium]